MNKTFDEVLPSFLEGKKIELKPKTYAGYVGKTRVISEWLKENNLSDKPLREISDLDLTRFFNQNISLKLDRPTVKKYFNTLQSILQYALDMGSISQMPAFKGLKFPPKGKDCSAEVIPSEGLKSLLNDIQENDKQLFLASMVEYYCFIRPRTELRLIRGENFDMTNGTIRIDASVAKNGRQRIVTMPTQLIEICREYGIGMADPKMYVFGKNKHFDTRPVSVNMLSYRFNQFRDKHNLSKGVKFYSFKHTGATKLHNSKVVSMVELQEQLGHSNLTATAHYLKKKAGIVNTEIRNNFPSPI